jgi:hypothetical protein
MTARLTVNYPPGGPVPFRRTTQLKTIVGSSLQQHQPGQLNLLTNVIDNGPIDDLRLILDLG